ncbi:hypothetical protein SAMN05192550_1079 [Flavobacterium glycines]|uniref:DUF6268 domain-containing protein n=2 Tax=Flavobacterium glycines TaxID=551990 RepID=A0A1B9DRW0_9FLAO|nr:hypothetical protein FBGL_07180 [Flavobacterium glycines]GEL09904.1 hypothetical protein FGL01_06430 [Flavobacterium glycines]SDI89101.1 hypothetical protein SAMN05192550_1079 [Flavobacterium glycines]
MKLKYYTTLIFMISILKITAQSSYSLELNIKTIPTAQITKNETEVGFSFSKDVDSKNKMTNSIGYKSTLLNYNLDNYYSAENKNNFNRIENNLELSHQFNKKTALNLELKTVAAFENNLDFSDVNLFGGAEFQYNFSQKSSINLGIKRMSVFGKAQVLPTIAFYSKLNVNTSLELGFPNTSIHYSNNDRNTFSLNNSFDGEFYKLDQSRTISPNLSAGKISFSQMTTAFEYERNVDRNWFLNFQGGYQFNKKYILTDNRGTTKFNFDANDGYLFNIGIKYKP